ncbi:unnamed protein product [Danaus chrysippus]|uniref:(African queen) hypothetical protein n=1 Tax=Danaus chrysippus TaxID=151541 RepID=A0A8J2QMT2_9NEOP|nr:unnamed protein product [Danaus chrysippus]
MDKTEVKGMLDDLKSSTSKIIIESLLRIKSMIVNSERGSRLFRECNGFPYLVQHLLKPNENILNLTLSILGDLCLEQKSCIAIGKLNTYGPLVTILNTVCRDSILGRTSRLIGNLARDRKNAEKFFDHGTVKALMAIIDNRDKKTSYATLIMVVRAIRKLWSVEGKRNEMISMNAIRCIAILMTSECEIMGYIKSSDSDNDVDEPTRLQMDFMGGILKCIWTFTSHPVSSCAEQIQGDGRGYQSLVVLTKTNTTIAMKCLTNLCFISSCRPQLGMAGFVECLIENLKKEKDPTYWPDGSPMALAQLSGESVNRSRLRRCGGLPLLVNAAKMNTHAMNALLQYVFDDSSFQILIGEGLVSILTDKLTTYVRNMSYEHNVTTGLSKEQTKPKEKPVDQGFVYDVAVQNLSGDMFFRPASGSSKRKSQLLSDTGDDMKVVIERDNMIVGFVDAIESEASESESENEERPPPKKRNLKRSKSKSPKNSKKKSTHIASKDWSSGVFWEPKSPELPVLQSNPSTSTNKEPQLPDLNAQYTGPGSGDRVHVQWSPESGVSIGEFYTPPHAPWSPNRLTPSPISLSNEDDSSDSEASGSYSPVCSDNDETNEGTTNKTQDEEVIEIDEDSNEEESDTEDLSNLNIHSKETNIACVMVLLFRVSHGACTTCGSIRDDSVPNHSMDYLTTRECLYGLMEYVEKCKRPMGRASRILARVLSSDLCLMSVMRHKLALRLYRMSTTSKHPPTECTQCKQIMKLSKKLMNQMGSLAESSYGIGKISYHLLKGSPSMKHTLAMTLPYIVKTEKALKKYLVDCNGLNILINLIDEGKEELQECVIALSKLAHNIDVKDPKLLEKRYKEAVRMMYEPNLDSLSPESIVTFKLDDSSTVRANKDFLCQHSEYFNAMLMGNFKESAENCVRLKNVTKGGLEYLLTLLDCGLYDADRDLEIFPMAPSLKATLEVLLLADRFLLEKLKELLFSAILQFKLSPNTADRIYTWSLSDGMGLLCVEAVAYILTGKMSDENRYQSFSKILNLQYKQQFLEDIKAMLLRQMAK